MKTELLNFIKWQISKKNFWLIFPVLLLFIFSFSVFGALTDGMIGYYSFDINCSINDYNSTLPASPTAGVESTNTSAKIGKSCFFTSGEFDMIILNNVASYLSNSNYTFSIWASRGSMTSYKGVLGWGKSQYSYKVQYRSDNKIQTAMERQTAPYEDNIVVSSQAYSTDFLHIVVSFTNEGKIKRVYINNTLIGSDEGQSVDTSSMTELFLGGVWAGTGSANHYDGYLDEFGFWNRELSISEINELYNSGNGKNPLTNVTPTPTNLTIIYNGKVPNDLNTGNVFGIVNISYNITKGTNEILNNTLYYRINDSVSNNKIFFNQTSINTFLPFPPSYNKSDTYYYQLKDNNYLPAIYEYSEMKMENTIHNKIVLNSTNRWRCLFNNITQASAPFGFYESYINKTSGGAGNGYNLYFVNDLGQSGLFFDTNSNPLLNHTHNQSKHFVYSFPVVNNQIGGVNISNIGYIEGIVESSVNVELEYIPDINSNCQYSTNAGSTWNNLGYVDNHLHFFSNTTLFSFYEKSCDSLFCIDSSISSDLIELTGNLPPSSPIIISPVLQNYAWNESILFDWANGISPNEYTVITTETNIYYLNNSIYISNISIESFYLTITTPNYYYFEVKNCDINNLCSFGYSDLFNITPQIPNTPIIPTVNISGVIVNVNTTDIKEGLITSSENISWVILIIFGYIIILFALISEQIKKGNGFYFYLVSFIFSIITWLIKINAFEKYLSIALLTISVLGIFYSIFGENSGDSYT